MSTKKSVFIFFTAALLFIQNAFSLEVPAMNGRVNDYAKILNSSQEREISEYLEKLENSTGIQIAVLTINSLKGENLEDFSIRTVEKWKLGDKKEDNGALLLVSFAERKIRIEVGYGLEPLLTDTKCGMIIRNIIAPAFRNGNYAAGIYSAVRTMGAIASGNAPLAEKAVSNAEDSDDLASLFYGLLFVIGWILFFSRVTRHRFLRWLPWFWLGSMSSSRHHDQSSFESFSGFGSSSGSSFRGGGGHFGGGGASGGW